MAVPNRAQAALDVAGVATAVRACPLVAGLYGGRNGRITTPAGPVPLAGVRVQGNCLVVGVVGRPGRTIDEIAAQVREVLSVLARDFQVTISVRAAEMITGGSLARN